MTNTQPPEKSGLDRLGETTTLAVSYLRVSTKEQAERGGRDEGFSIPAQREANLRKARDREEFDRFMRDRNGSRQGYGSGSTQENGQNNNGSNV